MHEIVQHQLGGEALVVRAGAVVGRLGEAVGGIDVIGGRRSVEEPLDVGGVEVRATPFRQAGIDLDLREPFADIRIRDVASAGAEADEAIQRILCAGIDFPIENQCIRSLRSARRERRADGRLKVARLDPIRAYAFTCGHMADSIVGVAGEGSRTLRVLTDHRGRWGSKAPVALGSTWPPCCGNGASITSAQGAVKSLFKVRDESLTGR
ncbi:MAG: hypothetical protein U0470_00670 [Anaerolineae bacterium]